MTENRASRRSLFVSLKVKLMLGFTLLFTVVFTLTFLWFYQFTTSSVLKLIEEDMVDTLAGVAAGIDAGELLALAQDGQVNEAGFSDDPRFIQQLDWLDLANSFEPRAWPYTYIHGPGENEVIFIADLWARHDPGRAASFLEPYVSTGPLIDGLDGLTTVMTPYTDPWGRWVSAYMPIRDAAGVPVGGVGLDFSAAYVSEVERNILDSVVVAFAITYFSLFVLVYLAAHAFTRPINRLSKVAEHVGEGKYHQDFSPLRPKYIKDEIANLATVFESMVAKVYARERSLQQQVRELRIEIDETKRQQQVSEIVESDFFKDLQGKAKTMRNRSTTRQKTGGES